ncbi:MAG: hypothetical protein V4598_15025 [Bdellovibrionota bacterium]
MKLIIALLFVFSTQGFAGDVKVILPGKDYGKYSNDELRMRIWNLENAVMQLQQKVFAMEVAQTNASSAPTGGFWTCSMKSFGKSFSHTAPTKTKAMADVIADCSKNTNAIHCDEDEVICGQ